MEIIGVSDQLSIYSNRCEEELPVFSQEKEKAILKFYEKLAKENPVSLLWNISALTQQAREATQEMHPLSFLLLVHSNKGLKKHLLKIKKSYENNVLGGEWNPWTRTKKSIAKAVQKHIDKEILCLRSFLTKVPNKSAQVQDLINQRNYESLLEVFLT